MILKKMSKATTSSTTTGLETPVNYHHQQRNHNHHHHHHHQQYLNACSLADTTTNSVGIETADGCATNSSLVHASGTGYPSSTPTNQSVIFGQSNVLFGPIQAQTTLYGDASSSYCSLPQSNNSCNVGNLGLFDPSSQSCTQSLNALNCYAVAAAQTEIGSSGGGGGYLTNNGNNNSTSNCSSNGGGGGGGTFQWNQYSDYIPFAAAPYEPFNPSFGHDAHQVVSQMVPSSGTYKWMQIKRSGAKVGTVNIYLTVI